MEVIEYQDAISHALMALMVGIGFIFAILILGGKRK